MTENNDPTTPPTDPQEPTEPTKRRPRRPTKDTTTEPTEPLAPAHDGTIVHAHCTIHTRNQPPIATIILDGTPIHELMQDLYHATFGWYKQPPKSP